MNTTTAVEVDSKPYIVNGEHDGVLELVDETGREYIGMPTHNAPGEFYLSGCSRHSKVRGTFTIS